MTEQLTLDWEKRGDPLEWFEPGQLIPWPGLNPRRRIDQEKLLELAASIRANGVLQNIVVHDTGNGVKWVVVGETRLRAAQLAGARIPARVGRFTEAQALGLAMLENLNRNDLTPIEEAQGMRRMRTLEPDLTMEELGKRLGLSQSHVVNVMGLLELPEPVQQLVDNGTIAWSLARDSLVPWAKEEAGLRDRFFRILLSFIGGRGNDDTITRVWLAPVVQKVGDIVRGPQKPAPAAPAEKKESVPSKPAPKPSAKFNAPPPGPSVTKALTEHKLEASSFKAALRKATLEECQQVIKAAKKKVGNKKRVAAIDARVRELEAEQRKAATAAKKKPARKGAVEAVQEVLDGEPVREEVAEKEPDAPVAEASADSQDDVVHAAASHREGAPVEAEAVCIHCGCKDSKACIGGCTWLAVDRKRGLGVCSKCAAGPATAARDLAAVTESPDPDATLVHGLLLSEPAEEPETEPIAGIVGALLPLLDDCSVTIAIARLVQPRDLCIVVTPRPTELKKQLAPLTVSGTDAEIEAKLLAALPNYVDNLIGAGAPPPEE